MLVSVTWGRPSIEERELKFFTRDSSIVHRDAKLIEDEFSASRLQYANTTEVPQITRAEWGISFNIRSGFNPARIVKHEVAAVGTTHFLENDGLSSVLSTDGKNTETEAYILDMLYSAERAGHRGYGAAGRQGIAGKMVAMQSDAMQEVQSNLKRSAWWRNCHQFDWTIDRTWTAGRLGMVQIELTRRKDEHGIKFGVVEGINKEFILPNNPRLVFRDSQGFSHGDGKNFDTVLQFIKQRSAMPKLEDRLHVIWRNIFYPLIVPLTPSISPGFA
ncbi:hypothetical protein B0H19DRAFT_1297871 [Mycena capillaripes]|nr:hypothetical protein B0H19DRAFT_1297871 [Mycena capillaripes]